MDEITSLAWNAQVPHVLATSSSSGYTVVWDLKGKREVVALQYGGGAGTAGGSLGGLNGMGGALAAGGRRGMSAVAWHPDTPTRLITASEDDTSPIIMLWDLRNSRAPEKIMTGHDKGVLSVSWCKQDADLLLSCGKDNRAICWNPQTCEIVGELPSSSNWSFEVQWCPRNPGMLATASFDGKIGVHSLQSTNAAEAEASVAAAAPVSDGSDFFNMPAEQQASFKGISLKQPPKWLRRPVSASFGFGGQLISTSNVPSTSGQPQSGSVHLRDVVSEPSIVQRATKLQQALETQTLAQFCDERSKDSTTRPDDVANWKALQTLFQADSRDELVALLGFSKEDVAAKVSTAIAAFKSTDSGTEPAKADQEPEAPAADKSSSASATAIEAEEASETTTDVSPVETGVEDKPAQSESEVTEPSLFGDDSGAANGVSTDDSGADFFNQISQGTAAVKSALPDHVLGVPAGSSAAATVGSPGPSSVASESIRATTFKIYPSEESEADKLITRALVLGDFESAVSLCISSDRFADALLLAVCGGEDLLARTQKAYFEKRTSQLPYLRLFQSIVSDDLTDVVQNADLTEWQEIFVVLCTFAKQDEFSNLAEQLGQRLEYQYASSRSSDLTKAKEHRKNAVLCYLAAGKLEKVAGMWIDEMKEEELALRKGSAKEDVTDGTLYSAHAEALQTFMEKITVFQNAVKYVDVDLAQPTKDEVIAESGARTYKLAALYDRIHEYIDLLADQGLIAPALKYVEQTPADYRPKGQGKSNDLNGAFTAVAVKERLTQAHLARPKPSTDASAGASTSYSAGAATSNVPATNGYQGYSPYTVPSASTSSVPSVPSVPTVPSIPAQDPYAAPLVPSQQSVAAQPPTQSRYAPAVPAPAPAALSPQPPTAPNAYGAYAGAEPVTSPYGAAQPMVPAPPSIGSAFGSQPAASQPPPPPPPKRDAAGGWNDVPEAASSVRRTASAMGHKVAAITSPFPNSPSSTPAPYGAAPPQGPPRGATPSRGLTSPPPQGPPFGVQYGARPGGGVQSPPGYRPPPGGAGVPPPPRPGQGAPQQPGQFGQPPQQGPPGQQGPYGRPPSAAGPYGPPGGGPTGALRPPPGGGVGAPGQQPGLPGMGPPGMGPPGMGPPGGAPMRAVTPGAGAGAPARSATPGGGRGAPQLKYPAGDRSHIADGHKPILETLTRELSRLKSVTPPTQKRMVDDTERRINLLLDHLNCGTLDAKIVQGLLQLCSAMDARNQQAALNLHLQLATSASGDVTAALVGVKMLISRMGA